MLRREMFIQRPHCENNKERGGIFMSDPTKAPTKAVSPNDRAFSKTSILNYIASFFAQFGTQGLAYTMFSSFLTVVYVEYLGVSAVAIGLVTSVGVFIDCATDIIMGNIVDRVHTKWGKVRHWFLWTALPIGVFIGLMFMVPVNSSDAVKLIWAAIIYNLYCTALTAARVPAWAMPSVVSDNSQVRLFMVWISSYGTNVAATITGWIITPFVGGFADQLTGYRALCWFLGGLTVVCMVIVFLCLSEKRKGKDLELIERERKAMRAKQGKKNADKAMGLGEQYGYLIHNKYWVGYQVAALCNSCCLSFMISSMAIFALHVLGSSGHGGDNPMGVLITIMNIPMMIAPFFVLPFSKKVDARTLVVVLTLIGGIVTGIQWIMGLDFWMTWVVCMVVGQSVGSMCNGTQAVLLTRAIDYGEWKFGVRQEGVGSSFSSSMNKICAGICSALLGVLLGAAGYSQAAGLPESGKAIVTFMFLGIPCIARILSAICYQFLSMGGKEWTQIRAELDARHAADAAKESGLAE